MPSAVSSCGSSRQAQAMSRAPTHRRENGRQPVMLLRVAPESPARRQDDSAGPRTGTKSGARCGRDSRGEQPGRGPSHGVGEQRARGAHRQRRRRSGRYGRGFHDRCAAARFDSCACLLQVLGIAFAACRPMRSEITRSERGRIKLALEPGGYSGTEGLQPPEVAARPAVGDLPPIMILADHFGYADGVRHGVTTYFLHVLPLLAAAGIELTVCFLRAPHAAAADLQAQGIRPVFFDAGKWDPTVAVRIATLVRRKGVRLLHATGVKGTLTARIAARLTGARTLLHVHDLNDPGTALSALQRLVAQPTDAAVCVSKAVRELTVSRYHVRPERVRVARNGIPLEALRSAGAGARSRVRAELGIESGRPVLAVIGRMHPVK